MGLPYTGPYPSWGAAGLVVHHFPGHLVGLQVFLCQDARKHPVVLAMSMADSSQTHACTPNRVNKKFGGGSGTCNCLRRGNSRGGHLPRQAAHVPTSHDDHCRGTLRRGRRLVADTCHASRACRARPSGPSGRDLRS